MRRIALNMFLSDEMLEMKFDFFFVWYLILTNFETDYELRLLV